MLARWQFIFIDKPVQDVTNSDGLEVLKIGDLSRQLNGVKNLLVEIRRIAESVVTQRISGTAVDIVLFNERRL